MSQPVLLPSTVDVFVRWAKQNTNITGVFGQNISTTLPKREDQRSYPWLQVMRVIGQPLFPQARIDRARLQFNSYGGVKGNGLPDWGPADLGIRTLEAEIAAFEDNYEIYGAVIEQMTGLEGIMQLEDPETHEARFWMDAIVLVRNA